MNIKELNEYIESSFSSKFDLYSLDIKIEEIFSLVKEHKLVHEFRLKKGIHMKKFVEEIIPLKLFMEKNSEIKYIKSNLGNENYDATGYMNDSEILIEITSSNINHQEHLRMEVLNNNRHVGAFNYINAKKTKKSGLQELLEEPSLALGANEIFTKVTEDIAKVTKKKAEKPYSNNHWLIIVYDDHHMFNEINTKEDFNDYLRNHCLFKELSFKKVIFQGNLKGNYTEFVL